MIVHATCVLFLAANRFRLLSWWLIRHKHRARSSLRRLNGEPGFRPGVPRRMVRVLGESGLISILDRGGRTIIAAGGFGVPIAFRIFELDDLGIARCLLL